MNVPAAAMVLLGLGVLVPVLALLLRPVRAELARRLATTPPGPPGPPADAERVLVFPPPRPAEGPCTPDCTAPDVAPPFPAEGWRAVPGIGWSMCEHGRWQPAMVWTIDNDHPNAPQPPPGHYAWRTDPTLRNRAPKELPPDDDAA